MTEREKLQLEIDEIIKLRNAIESRIDAISYLTSEDFNHMTSEDFDHIKRIYDRVKRDLYSLIVYDYNLEKR